MALKFHFHPLSSYCHKVLFALYENETAFTPVIVNLGTEEGRSEFAKVSPLGKMPVLVDVERNRIVLESTIILEYLDTYHPGKTKLFPKDTEENLNARFWDRIADDYLHVSMQKIVGDLLRAEKDRDPFGVQEAKQWMEKAYTMMEKQLGEQTWLLGEELSVADCGALPPLFYAQMVHPYSESHPQLAAYFERLIARPSVQRVLTEAKPFFKYFPLAEKIPARFL